MSFSISEKDFLEEWIDVVFDNGEKRQERMEFMKVPLNGSIDCVPRTTIVPMICISITGWVRLIRSHSSASFCIALSGIRINSKY